MIHHRATEDTEKSFCLSGDTDKQKDSASKAFYIENHGYLLLMLVPSLLKLMHTESLVIY